VADEVPGEGAAVLHGPQDVADDGRVLLDGRELVEEAVAGGDLGDVLPLEPADRGQQVRIALGAQLVLRPEVVHHEARAHAGVGRDGAHRGAEALHREPVDRGVADPGARGEVARAFLSAARFSGSG
jgi:hypothetical protein